MTFEKVSVKETLAEKVCGAIKDAILSGEFKGGELLPSEPNLEKQFGVSRAVIRDAVRMLKALGLVDVRQGKGMYVSLSQREAFTGALLLSLQREGGTVWDVEQFESLFMAQAAALGAISATSTDIETVKKNRESYMEKFRSQVPGDEEELHSLYEDFAKSFLSCTHNKLFVMMGEVLITLRMWRNIEGLEAMELVQTVEAEEAILNLFVEALESGNPDRAAELMKKAYSRNVELEKLLRSIPAGTVPEIPAELFREVYLRDK